jgi:hypothetical protein
MTPKVHDIMARTSIGFTLSFSRHAARMLQKIGWVYISTMAVPTGIKKIAVTSSEKEMEPHNPRWLRR